MVEKRSLKLFSEYAGYLLQKLSQVFVDSKGIRPKYVNTSFIH